VTYEDRPTVRVVDHDPDRIENLSIHLRAAGFRARSAGDGLHAFAAVGAHRPELVLADAALPDMATADLCARLRRRSAVPHARRGVDQVRDVATQRAHEGQQVPPPVGVTTWLANCSVSPVLTYHSQRVPSGPCSHVSVLAA
jgi:CheY-like chemotaxis protein